METQSDLFVLSSALEDCHQGTHVHLDSNVIVHHPVGSIIPYFHSVQMVGKTDVRNMFRYTWLVIVP